MSSSRGSFAVTATSYGAAPADAYYALTAPGLVNGPLEVTGNLTVDGTSLLKGAVTCNGALAAGAITGTLLTTTTGLVQSAVDGVSTFAGVVGFSNAVNLGPNVQFTGTVGSTTYGTPAAPIPTLGAPTCSQAVGVIRMTYATGTSLGALIPLDAGKFTIGQTVVICTPTAFAQPLIVTAFAASVISGGTTGVQLELIMSVSAASAGNTVDASFMLINSL